jgi:hypothetical protein
MVVAAVSGWVVTAIGAVVGLVGGWLGKGGSAVATPLLHLAGVPALVAVAAPLPAAVPATAAAAWTYGRKGMVDGRVLGWTVIWGIPATVAGAVATAWIGGHVLIVITDVIVAGMGVRVLVRPVGVRAGGPEPSGRRLALVALAVGGISGLLANSGGFLLAPLFVAVLGLPIKRALGTSLAAACVLAVPGTVVHAVLGHLDWGVVVRFGLASIPLSAVGARLALRTDAAQLERGYGAVLTSLGLVLLAAS